MDLNRQQVIFAIVFATLFCSLLFFFQRYDERKKDINEINQKELDVALIVNKNEKLDQKALKVAVLDFAVTVVWLDRHKKKNEQLKKNIALKNREKMEVALLQAGFNLIERIKIDKVLEEQALLKKGITENNLVKIGKLLNADIVVFGTIPQWVFYKCTDEGFLEIITKGIFVNTGSVFFKGTINHHFISNYDIFRYEIALFETKGFKILGEKLENWLNQDIDPDIL